MEVEEGCNTDPQGLGLSMIVADVGLHVTVIEGLVIVVRDYAELYKIFHNVFKSNHA